MMLLAALMMISAQTNAGQIAVEVTSAPEEQLARRFESAVRKSLDKDPRFVVSAQGQGGVTIALPSRLGWERRLDWTEIHYQARLNSANGRTEVVAGYCWNWNLAVCAKQIADAAAKFSAN